MAMIDIEWKRIKQKKTNYIWFRLINYEIDIIYANIYIKAV